MPLDVNKILTPAMVRITGDITDDADGTKCLKTILGGTPLAFKGPRRPEKVTVGGTQVLTSSVKSFTIHVLSNPRDEDSKAHNGTLLINFYCPNYSNGNANVELMGPVAARAIKLFDDQPLTMDGYVNFNLTVDEPLGPLFDPASPGEHFMSIRMKFSIY